MWESEWEREIWEYTKLNKWQGKKLQVGVRNSQKLINFLQIVDFNENIKKKKFKSKKS